MPEQQLITQVHAELTGRIIVVLASAGTIFFLARFLGPTGYGLLFLSLTILEMGRILSELGIPQSTARYLADYKETDREQIPHILKSGLIFIFLTSGFASLVLLVSHRWISRQLNEPQLGTFLLMGIPFLILGAWMTLGRKSLQGLGAIRESSLVNAVQGASRLFFAVGFVLLGFGAVGALLGYIVASGIAASVGAGILFLRYRDSENNIGRIEKGLRRRIAEYSLPLSVTDAMRTVDTRVDTILVGFYLSPIAVSFYVLGKQVVTFVDVPGASLGFSVSPRYASAVASHETELARKIYEESLTYAFTLYLPAVVGLVLIAHPFIEIIFGAEYLGAVPVIQILGIYIIFLALMRVTSQGLDYLGRAKSRAFARGTAAALNIILNIILIPRLGVAGAALATVFTYGIYTFANFYFMNEELDLRFSYLGRNALLVGLISLPIAGFIYYLSPFIKGGISLAGTIGGTIALWLILTMAVGLIDFRKIINDSI